MSTCIKIPPANSQEDISELSQQIQAPFFITSLLWQRGIREKEQARRFFLAKESGSVSSEMFLGLNKALKLLTEIRQTGEKLIIHGDYDVDGITATAIAFKGLLACGFNVGWYLPDRQKDGYGITEANIRKMADQGVRWLLTVDTGVSAFNEVALAKSLGLGVIITDHHQVPDVLPDADVIINPNQKGCAYPNKAICGAGIAYRLIDALYVSLLGRQADEFSDLAAIGSLGDVVPMNEENRSLIRKGMRLLPNTSNSGLRALIKAADVDPANLSSIDLSFKIIPVLNAAGRLSSPSLALELLIAEDGATASNLVGNLQNLNKTRRELDKKVYGEALSQVENDDQISNGSCLVLFSENWHEGVIGIVAAKLVERFNRPVFILCGKDGELRGSSRSVEGFHLHKALQECQDLLIKWGGHYYAAGFSLPLHSLETFRQRMLSLSTKYLGESSLVKTVKTDAVVSLGDINNDSMLWLKRFEPFGMLNEYPVLYAGNLELCGQVRVLGGEHLKFMVKDGNVVHGAIAFGFGMQADELTACKKFNMAFSPEWNFFRGNREIQLRVVAIDIIE